MELTSYNEYANEVFEWSKTVLVKTADRCVEVEAKLAELVEKITEVREFKEDSNKRFRDRILLKLEASRNLLEKQTNKFTGIETQLKTKREELERKRSENLAKLKSHAPAPVEAKAEPEPEPEPEPVKKKPGRPKRS